MTMCKTGSQPDFKMVNPNVPVVWDSGTDGCVI
jgi:hypothetical protein